MLFVGVHPVCCLRGLYVGTTCDDNICTTLTHVRTQTQVEEDPTGGKLASTSGRLNGAPHKIWPIINFHVGDTVTSLQRAALQPGGQEVCVFVC